jgi:hypothetical protein
VLCCAFCSCTLLAASLVVDNRGRSALLAMLGVVNIAVVAIFLYHIVKTLWLWVGAAASEALSAGYKKGKTWWLTHIGSKLKARFNSCSGPMSCFSGCCSSLAGAASCWGCWRGKKKQPAQQQSDDKQQGQQGQLANGHHSSPAVQQDAQLANKDASHAVQQQQQQLANGHVAPAVQQQHQQQHQHQHQQQQHAAADGGSPPSQQGRKQKVPAEQQQQQRAAAAGGEQQQQQPSALQQQGSSQQPPGAELQQPQIYQIRMTRPK